ncbi:MAG: MFS transporter [Acidimicrobiales bacterium]|nr:MFS transporter [Acidimicrobiales bacterium]
MSGPEGVGLGDPSLVSGPGTADGSPMTAALPLPESADGGAEGSASGIDRMRLRSFIGLTLGLVGPRANLAVSGVLLTLLVSARVSSALAITFALTANRLIGWLAYPLLGRASDRTHTAAGRRAPYMAAGLLIMGVCTWSYTLVSGFWPLVLLIVLVKTASVVFGLTNVAVIPETFGKSRSVKAAALIGLLGVLVSLVIKGTVIATWKANDPATWNLAFRMAGGFMVVVAFIVLLLVRESAAAREVADRERHRRARPWREELAEIWQGPNAKVLVTGIMVFWAGLSATGYLAIVYFQRVQHAGANSQTIAGWVSGVPVIMLGLALGYALSRVLTRKQIAVLTPVAGSVVSLVQFTTTHIWQSVVLAFVGGPLFGAFAISLAPMLLQLLPRSGGMGELLGKLVAPFSLFAVVFSFLAAWVVDLTGDYRTIWLWPAAAGIVQAVVMCWLKIPKGQERAQMGDLVQRMGDSIMEQVTGEGRSLLGGVVTAADADSASVFDMARHVLGNPYEERRGGVVDRTEGVPEPADVVDGHGGEGEGEGEKGEGRTDAVDERHGGGTGARSAE